jgi:hypothetical protein
MKTYSSVHSYIEDNSLSICLSKMCFKEICTDKLILHLRLIYYCISHAVSEINKNSYAVHAFSNLYIHLSVMVSPSTSEDYRSVLYWIIIKPRFLSRYSDGYGLDGRGSNPGRGNIFLFYTTSTPALGPTQPPIHWCRKWFPRDKAAGAWSLPIASIWCWGQEWWSYTSTFSHVCRL